jgi:hypothetical protein
MRREVLVLVGVVMLVSAACSGDDSAPVTTVVAPSTTAAPTTTAPSITTLPPSTTTMAPATTTTSIDESETVGDPEALTALVEEALEEVRFLYEDESITVDIPDLTNLDPATALQEINELGTVAAASFPARTWAGVVTYPGSPSEAIATEVGDTNYFDQLVRVSDSPLEYVSIEVVDLSSLDLPSEVSADMPAGSVGLLYVTNLGRLVLLDRTTGEFVREVSAAWENRPILGILSPTATGWKEWATILDFGESV